MLKIYGGPTPNPVKVLMVAEELGLDYEYKYVNLVKGENRKPEYLKIQPYGKIPAIEHDGNYIYESNAICRYLANISGGKLYSKNPLRAAQIDQVIDLMTSQVGYWVNMYFFQELILRDLMGADVNQEKITEAAKNIKKQLPYINGLLETNGYLCGDEITLADLIAFAIFMSHEHTNFSIENYENISRWYAEIKSRPSYGAMMRHFPGGYKFS